MHVYAQAPTSSKRTPPSSGRPLLRKGEKKIPDNNEFVYDYDEALEEAVKLFGASAIVRGTELGVCSTFAPFLVHFFPQTVYHEASGGSR